ncbi:enoyl-CoA hydratase [Biformimicrobium ophioploci]|uniref:Enoyl-CoA hydratase n=1 Tax=Biformimicrobium ophioploci TaxID=3036711 RepID=A0ABQ6M0Z9_9GAMM|nr:enoyl-CoA hydratase [Microbulbifer sp. NKW57]GMG88030.1 enoyl-CoA hydratase [Microbulbifer sp. NKW57]
MTDLLKIDKQGHTTVVTMNNPPANTWTPDSLNAFRELVLELGSDPDNRALVLASDNEKFFSAGADLKKFACSKGDGFTFINAFGAAFEALADYPGVSVAAITGYAMGGGLEGTLACDFRVAEKQAQLALPEASVGLLPGGLGTQLLPWLVGESWAKRMILLGERLSAEQALEIGLVQEVVDTGKALEKALEMVARAAKQSPSSIRACKQLIQAARHRSMASAASWERELFTKLWDTQDRDEGVSAFLEKRKPEWKGR